MEVVKKCDKAECDYYIAFGECSSVCKYYNIKPTLTNYDRIRNMSILEMAKFLKSMVDDNETHEVACYGCINYGTHHSDPENKGTNLYECEGCSCEGIGHDLVKWLESEAG